MPPELRRLLKQNFIVCTVYEGEHLAICTFSDLIMCQASQQHVCGVGLLHIFGGLHSTVLYGRALNLRTLPIEVIDPVFGMFILLFPLVFPIIGCDIAHEFRIHPQSPILSATLVLAASSQSHAAAIVYTRFFRPVCVGLVLMLGIYLLGVALLLLCSRPFVLQMKDPR